MEKKKRAAKKAVTVSKKSKKPVKRLNAKNMTDAQIDSVIDDLSKEMNVTVRNKALIKAILSGQSPRAAMRTAQYSEKTIRKSAHVVIRRLEGLIDQVLDKFGIDDELVMGILRGGLEATKVVGTIIMPGPDMKANEMAASMPDAAPFSKDYVEVPDWATRHKYVESYLKMRGYFDRGAQISSSQTKSHVEKIDKIEAWFKKKGIKRI